MSGSKKAEQLAALEVSAVHQMTWLKLAEKQTDLSHTADLTTQHYSNLFPPKLEQENKEGITQRIACIDSNVYFAFHSVFIKNVRSQLRLVQGGSNMTGTNCDLFTRNQSRSYLNHLVYFAQQATYHFLHILTAWSIRRKSVDLCKLVTSRKNA
jgi:hypothetical protein